MFRTSSPPLFILVSALSLISGRLIADLPIATLSTITPAGGKLGTDVEVALTGADLDEATALHFSHPGITSTAKEKKFVVKIGPEVPPGIYDTRVAGKFGLSNPRAFVVGDAPETAEAKANDNFESAAEIAIGSVFHGAVTAASADHLKFTAKQGQRLFVHCSAADIDSRLTPVLALFDAQRREIAGARRSGFVDFSAPADGDYFLKVHDLTFAGGPDYFYRLSLTTAPRIDFVFPPFGAAGKKANFTLYGRGLPNSSPAGFPGEDGISLEKLEVEIDVPAEAPAGRDGLVAPNSGALEGYSYRLASPQGLSNLVFVSTGNSTPVLEQEPNNQPDQTQKIAAPCEIAGQFYPANDRDAFSFDAKKGDVYWVEVISDRLGAATNPFLLLQREGVEPQEVYRSADDAGGKRFSTVSNDPAARIEVKEDGTYRLLVRDLFGTIRSSPRSIYRLCVRKESPDFRLVALPGPQPAAAEARSAPPRALVFRPGETCPIRVVAFRRDNFAGDIELTAEDLPPGITAGAAKIPAGKNDGILLLTAAEGATAVITPIRVIGKAKLGEVETKRVARPGAVTWPIKDYNAEPVPARLGRDFLVAVTAGPPAPLSVEPAEQKTWEIAAGGKVEIPLKISRRGAFEAALKLKPFGAPEIEKAKEADAAEKATTATATIDLTAAKIPAGAHIIHFRADTKGKFNEKDTTYTVLSQPIQILVK